MGKKTAGIHHVTAIVGNPQENVDFYAGILGLRLVKRTINFDDPGTYHLYFGDDHGKPGTIMTFFPWQGAARGKIGGGQVGTTSFIVPIGAMPFWEKRLEKFQVAFRVDERFGEQFLEFEDPHGLRLEIVERNAGAKSDWSIGNISPETAIKGFGGATLLSNSPESTMELLVKMGLEKIDKEGEYVRYQAYGDIGNLIDLKLSPEEAGVLGAGTVHHIAWRADDHDDQLKWQQLMTDSGYQVTEVRDRNYFTSVYFREHGDLLFEIATDTPGFAVDEPYEKLGEQLKLPEWYEPQRERLEQVLVPIEVRELDNE